MSPAVDAVIQRLDAARQKWWIVTLLTTTMMAACVSFGTLLAFMLTDAFLKLSQVALLVMFLAWLALTIALIVAVTRRLLRSQRSLQATARRVESEYPELGSNLINLVQLSDDTKNEDQRFCQAAVSQAAVRIGNLPFAGAAAKQSRWRRFLYCMQTPRDLAESLVALVWLIAIAVLCHWSIPAWGSAFNRLMPPWSFVPSVGSVEIKVSPGDTDVMLGASLEIAAEIKKPRRDLPHATLFLTRKGEKETGRPMAADKEQQRFKLTLPSIIRPLTYRIEVGDSQTDRYTVRVRSKPTVDEVQVTFDYPPYMDRPKETFAQKHADLEAPQFTVAELRIRPSVPVAKGYVQLDGERVPIHGRVEHDGNLLVVKKMYLVKDTTFTVHLFNDAGHSDPDPRVNRIHVLPDRPPTVQLLKPARESTSASPADVPVMIRAGDDHGLGRLWLEMKIQGAPSGARPSETGETEPTKDLPPERLKQWTEFENDTTVVRQQRLELSPEQITPGDLVLVRAVAQDRRTYSDLGRDLKPQEAASRWHIIRIVGEETKSAAELEQLDRLRKAIWRILEKQIRARVRAAVILNKQQLGERAAVAGEVRALQIQIQKASVDLVNSIKQTDHEERLSIKRTLNKLAFGDMLQAVRQGDELLKLKMVEGFDRPVPELLATQDRIIELLRKLLDVARRAESGVLAEMKKRPGGDLPDDVEKKLQDLNDKLAEALKRQKKVVEAAENLAKAPVEDFSEEKEQLLKVLAAAEDDWSKFTTELNTDLSKLPEQDFANPSLLKELVEIQTEIKMAEDALLKKTADIAVPLEQLGAEMAEEIKTNLEKWLPDTPDRERWSQEESLTDEGKEAPMAELPGELEDLIGELMEEEEDLFDEMEDVSSSAADSLDKGAGWDALDGPISNMSAKGATGNRLPNTSEIGGRAGEGRQAKSSGEFVGDEAVGKGGRKTPSRLTPDPYLKGQIKDHSKDPTGGVTGGGKESGQGGEGLEGPEPQSPGQRELQRLAGKQAALRNRAEGIELQFQVMNFHHTDLEKMIELMAQIERDLRTGRYQNALRRRKVLADGLGSVKQYLEGEFEVRQDTTANLPTDVQKEILGSMQDPSPAGWEELNRRYFERLSTGGADLPGGAPADGRSVPNEE